MWMYNIREGQENLTAVKHLLVYIGYPTVFVLFKDFFLLNCFEIRFYQIKKLKEHVLKMF